MSGKRAGAIRVLVYGTLKQGQSNEMVMEKAEGVFMGYESITGPYRMIDLGGLPAVVDSEEDKNQIRGQLYSVGAEGLATLDMLEGHPNFYCRSKVWTDLRKKRAWVYFMRNKRWQDAVNKTDTLDSGLWNPSNMEQKFWEARDAA